MLGESDSDNTISVVLLLMGNDSTETFHNSNVASIQQTETGFNTVEAATIVKSFYENFLVDFEILTEKCRPKRIT